MRILYIATSFPSPDKGSSIYTDLAEALCEFGHEVVVVVSEEKKNQRITCMNVERKMQVLRVVTGNYYDVSYIKKGITAIRAPYVIKHNINKYLRNEPFDLILYESPPVTNCRLICWLKKRYNCKTFLMLKDIFPQNAIDLGILKRNSFIYKYFIIQEKKLYSISDKIGCMSNANLKYINEHNNGITQGKLIIFPNTKKIKNAIEVEDVGEYGKSIRKNYNIPENACVFLFGGNMGRPQYVDLLCNSIRECRNDDNIYFLFIGRGTDRKKLEMTILNNDIRNAKIIDNLHRDEYEKIIKECDIGLIVLDPRFTIPNYPSRILSYMEYSKPILAATDKVTDIKELILDANCGEWIWSGDSREFIKKIREMAADNSKDEKGKNGRRFLEKNFDVKYSVKILENSIEDVKE